MKPSSYTGATILLALSQLSTASYPLTPQDVIVVNSTQFPGVSISYKETHICETTPGTKSYSGYVNLPPAPSEGRGYEIHTFFWFFEARNDPQSAPLSLWLQGGPGVPSIPAAVGENGPCYVNTDSKSTRLNPWSWNDKVNMLYIDQPVQTGFSYDTLVTGAINEIKSPFAVSRYDSSKSGAPQTNATYLAGTFASQDISTAPNSTEAAAIPIWHFMQTWLQEFPKYKPSNNRFSIWSESYGGHYGPAFANYFEAQNELIASAAISPPAQQYHLDTIGIINGCIDVDTQMPLYPEFAFNNTYGIQAINETVYKLSLSKIPECQNLTKTCREMADKEDPQGWGNSTAVNAACKIAYDTCFKTLHAPYKLSKASQLCSTEMAEINKLQRYHFDITSSILNSFPPKWAAGYLNTQEIQQALGVPLNFTGASSAISTMFDASGDFIKGHGLEYLGKLLDKGVKVALVYGDRDYQCNWLGGEQVSLAVNSQTTEAFKKAGYANIQTNDSYIGGTVRQVGNFSFSRVFEAGHEVPWYQPDTAYQIFNRIMSNVDVATGKVPINSYVSSGATSVFNVKTAAPAGPQHRDCYTWDIFETCDPGFETAILTNGTAIVKDYILVGYKDTNGKDVFFNSNGTSPAPGSGSGTGGDEGTFKSAAARSYHTLAMLLAITLGIALLNDV